MSVANPEKGALYTLIKTDPDAPSRAEPLFRPFVCVCLLGGGALCSSALVPQVPMGWLYMQHASLCTTACVGEFIHQVVVNIQSDGGETLVLTGRHFTLLLSLWITHTSAHVRTHTRACMFSVSHIHTHLDGPAGKGETALDYVGCGAPCNSGYHRYIWLLFKQTGKVSVGDTQKFFEVRFWVGGK